MVAPGKFNGRWKIKSDPASPREFSAVLVVQDGKFTIEESKGMTIANSQYEAIESSFRSTKASRQQSGQRIFAYVANGRMTGDLVVDLDAVNARHYLFQGELIK